MICKTKVVNVFFLSGFIFSLVGGITLALSLWMFSNMDYLIAHGEGAVELMPWIFCFTGGVSFAIGLILTWHSFRKWRRKQRLIRDGYSIMARIVDVPVDYSVRYNGFPTCIVKCQYIDPKSGKPCIFRSEHLRYPFPEFPPHTLVRVYVDAEGDFTKYFVDLDSLQSLEDELHSK